MRRPRRFHRRAAERRTLWIAVAAVVVLAAVLLGIVLATGGSREQRAGRVSAQQPAVQPIARGATAQQQARNISAWLRRYSR